MAVRGLTSGGTNSGGGPGMGGDEEGLDEGAQRVDDVPENLGGVLLHVVRLAEGAKRGSGTVRERE